MTLFKGKNNISTSQLIRYSILVYWSLFWLLNIIDKMIGGSLFLWVGRDRFAQFQKFFRLSGIGISIYCGLCSCDCRRFRSFCFCIFYGSIDSFFSKKYRIISVLVFDGDVFYPNNLYHFLYR